MCDSWLTLSTNGICCYWERLFGDNKDCYVKSIEDIWFFRCKIDFYFIEWTPKAVFSRVAKLLVFMSEIKINLTPEKTTTNFLFLSCLNVEKINLFQSVSRHHRKLTFFLVNTRQLCGVQCIYWVQYCLHLENSLKYWFDKWFAWNLQWKNARWRLSPTGVACFNYVTLAL